METKASPALDDTPAVVRRACDVAAEGSLTVVRCPRRMVPEASAASLLQPRRRILRPGAPGPAGERRYHGSRRFYVIEGHAKTGIDGGHWFIGGGSLSVLQQQFFRVSTLAASPSAAPCPHGQLRRYEDDGASMSSGHVVVLCRPGRIWYFASIHGHENADLATVLAQEVARGQVVTR